MDSHLLIKIIHMSFASLAILVFAIRGVQILLVKPQQAEAEDQPAQLPAQKGRVALVALQHLSYSVLIVAGVVLLVQNQFVVQPWFYAKIILFFVVLSASAKAFSKKPRVLLQRKAGVLIAAVAFISLLGLIVLKPGSPDKAAASTATAQVSTVNVPETRQPSTGGHVSSLS